MSSKSFVLRVTVAVTLSCVLSQIASADLVLSFSIDGGTNFDSEFDVLAGDSLTVGVYLQETALDTILTDEGLLGFGLAAVTSPTNLGLISAATINPTFDFPSTNEFTASTTNWEATVFLNSAPSGTAVELGTFQFDTNANGTTVFSFSDIQPGTGSANTNWLTGLSGSELDQQIFGAGSSNTFQFSINASSAVPEPSSIVMLSCLAFLFVGTRRKQ